MPKRSRRRKQVSKPAPATDESPPSQEGKLRPFNARSSLAKLKAVSEEVMKQECNECQPLEDGVTKDLMIKGLLVLQFRAAPYFDTYHQSLIALEQKEILQASELAWDAFKQATKWGGAGSPGRQCLLISSFHLFSDDNRHMIPRKHARRLRRLCQDQNELTTIRTMAAQFMGILPTEIMGLEEKMENVRAALMLEPSPEELTRQSVYVYRMDESDLCVSEVSKILQQYQEALKKLKVENESRVPSVLRAVDALALEDAPEVFRRLCEVGGGRCDYCKVTVEELGVAKLDFCSKCENAFYCGIDCQHKAWKGGHKQACRPAWDVRPGDLMRLKGLKNNPQMNGHCVQVMEHNTDSGKCTVHLYSNSPRGNAANLFVVKAENLKHIRPAA